MQHCFIFSNIFSKITTNLGVVSLQLPAIYSYLLSFLISQIQTLMAHIQVFYNLLNGNSLLYIVSSEGTGSTDHGIAGDLTSVSTSQPLHLTAHTKRAKLMS